MNYTMLTGAKTVEGSIRNWVNRTDVPASLILTEAQAWIFERLRVREMVHDVAFTFADGTSEQPLPADFLDPISFVPYQWYQAESLPLYDNGSFKRMRDADGNLYPGTPCGWSILGTTAILDVECEREFGGRLTYYRRPPELSGEVVTNWLTQRYPTLLRYACLAKAYEHMKMMASAKDYLLLAEEKLTEAARTNDMFRRSMYVSG